MKKISDEYQAVRKHKTVYGSVSGNYAFRGEKTIWFESTLERDFLLKQEFDDNVVDVVSQPITIPYTTELGNESTYTPDFLVQLSCASYFSPSLFPNPILIEIKPREKLIKDWVKLKPKFKAAIAFCREKGWDFKLMDEARIYDTYWKNLHFLKRYKRFAVEDGRRDSLINTLQKIGSCTVTELPSFLYRDETNVLYAIHDIWALISQKHIKCDLNLPLTSHTPISINSGETLLEDLKHD